MRDQDSNEATIFIHIDVWMWTNICQTTNKTESRGANASARTLFQHFAFVLRWKLPHLTVQNERINWIFIRSAFDLCAKFSYSSSVWTIIDKNTLFSTRCFANQIIIIIMLNQIMILTLQPNQKTNNFKSIDHELCTMSKTIVSLEYLIKRVNQSTAVVIQHSMVCIISL